MFSPLSVCHVCKIRQNILNKFQRNYVKSWSMTREPIGQIFGVITIQIYTKVECSKKFLLSDFVG